MKDCSHDSFCLLLYESFVLSVILIPSRLYDSSCKYMQVMMTTLLKVYIKGGLFERSRELLSELESAGYAENEVVRQKKKKNQ